MTTLGRPPLNPGQLRQAQQWLYQALSEPVGLLFRTDDPDRLVGLFYQARSALRDPDLNALVIKRWPDRHVAVGKPQVHDAAPPTLQPGDLEL